MKVRSSCLFPLSQQCNLGWIARGNKLIYWPIPQHLRATPLTSMVSSMVEQRVRDPVT